jgi:hypothetical protein
MIAEDGVDVLLILAGAESGNNEVVSVVVDGTAIERRVGPSGSAKPTNINPKEKKQNNLQKIT